MTKKIKLTAIAISAVLLLALAVIFSSGFSKFGAEAGTRVEKTREIRLAAETGEVTFTQEQFGGNYKEMPDTPYSVPDEYKPAENIQHPYLFFKSDDIPAIYKKLMGEDPEFAKLRDDFWTYADSENFTGEFPEESKEKNGVTYEYRFNTTVLAQLEAKALAYVMKMYEASLPENSANKTAIEDEAKVYGTEAIIGAKNVILTLDYSEGLHTDTYHGASQTMVNVAKVYDWCYGLMSEDDRNQIIAGVSNVLAPQMESGMRFPPSGMNGISGHGTGPQFIRDWVTISLAFYREVPSWWNYVGGRFFEEYVPAINYAYQGGFASQGTTTYGDSKYFTKGWAAWLIQNATGKFPYVENFHLGAYYYFSHLQPNDKYFQTGDGGRSPKGCDVDSGVAAYFMSALLFQDPTIAAMAKYCSDNYTSFYYEFTQESTVPDVLIWTALGPEIKEEPFVNIDTIYYLSYPSGTMTARESWDADAAAVLMRIGNMSMANHDLRDHGTFQIYYKGLLAGTSGTYKSYGSNVHKYYLQATVAHNGLLVFNPSFADENPNWNCGVTEEGHEHSNTTCAISNAERYYYSGSQKKLSEAGSIENWLSGNYNMAEVFGADMAYDKNGNAKWAYIAGDLTNAYSADTVDYVGRKMLTIFTGDENYPMLFFTYDQITSDSAEFTKTFLLHTVKEPVIDTEKLTAVVTEGEGRLFLHSVSGAGAISKIGGEGKAYWINGKNCLDTAATSDNASNIWGRIELTTSGNLEDNMLTAMYVTDAANDKALDVTKIANDAVDGAQIKNNVAIFTKTKNNAQQAAEFSFTVSGAGIQNYYVSGVVAGTWKVSVDDATVAYIKVDEGESILSFAAPAGTVSIEPESDVAENNKKIVYKTNGGLLSTDAPTEYADADVTLPDATKIVKIKKTDDKHYEWTFGGWYTDSDFTGEPITVLDVSAQENGGVVTLYAKWTQTTAEKRLSEYKYTLNYVTNNGTEIDSEEKGVFEESVLTTKLTNDGYSFGGWYTTSDFTGKAIDRINPGTFGEVNVYAKWIKNEQPAEDSSGIKEVSVTLGKSLSLNYYVESAEGLTMSFSADNGIVSEGVSPTLVTEGEHEGKYVFAFDGIGPHQLGMNVTATLSSGGVKQYSVEQYCRDALAIPALAEDESFVSLVNDLLLYAKAAEEYVEGDESEKTYKTGAWELRASENVMTASDDKMTVIGNTDAGLRFVSVGVEFGVQNRLYFKIYSNSPDTHKVTVGKTTYNVSDFEKIGDGYYKVYTEQLSGSELGATKLVVLNNGSSDVATLMYSVYTYAYYVKDYNGAGASMKNLAAALYRYGKSCEKYAGTLTPDDSFVGKDNVFN